MPFCRGRSPQGTFGRVVRQTDAPVLDEAGEAFPALEHVVHRLGDRAWCADRPARCAASSPRSRRAARSALAGCEALLGGQAVDLALDVEQGVDALDRLQRHGRDLAAPPPLGRFGDVGQLEELAPGVAQHSAWSRPRSAVGTRGRCSRIGVGLEDAGPTLQMPWDARPAVARERTAPPAAPAGEGAIVADIGPDPAGDGPPLARIGTVVSSPCSRSAARTWACDQGVQRRQRAAQAPTWSASVERLSSTPSLAIALRLPVQRLVLAELLEQDHRQQVPARPSRAGWRGRRRRLAIFSQSRQANFSRTVWITFHRRGITSSVSMRERKSRVASVTSLPTRSV